MSRVIKTIGGLCCLFMFAARAGFRMKSSAYWRWRDDTAFGHDPARRPPFMQRMHAMLDYGRWVWRMKRRM